MSKRTTKAQRQRRALKDKIFAAYGGYRCACCGEEEPEFLCLHHANHDGKAHRADLAMQSKTLFAWIIDHSFPPIFAVLCYNCHHSIHLKANRGICAHGRGVPKNIMPTRSTAWKNELVSFLKERGEATWREIHQGHRGASLEQLRSLLNDLEQRGCVSRRFERRGSRGPKTRVYTWLSQEARHSIFD